MRVKKEEIGGGGFERGRGLELVKWDNCLSEGENSHRVNSCKECVH